MFMIRSFFLIVITAIMLVIIIIYIFCINCITIIIIIVNNNNYKKGAPNHNHFTMQLPIINTKQFSLNTASSFRILRSI